MSYEPKPISTSGVELSQDLHALTERLAEHTHDVWALQRMAQGWTLGSQRDDAAKKHPCLVAYSELPENEKTFDRETALGTLKAVIALGYQISKKD